MNNWVVLFSVMWFEVVNSEIYCGYWNYASARLLSHRTATVFGSAEIWIGIPSDANIQGQTLHGYVELCQARAFTRSEDRIPEPEERYMIHRSVVLEPNVELRISG